MLRKFSVLLLATAINADEITYETCVLQNNPATPETLFGRLLFKSEGDSVFISGFMTGFIEAGTHAVAFNESAYDNSDNASCASTGAPFLSQLSPLEVEGSDQTAGVCYNGIAQGGFVQDAEGFAVYGSLLMADKLACCTLEGITEAQYLETLEQVTAAFGCAESQEPELPECKEVADDESDDDEDEESSRDRRSDKSSSESESSSDDDETFLNGRDGEREDEERGKKNGNQGKSKDKRKDKGRGSSDEDEEEEEEDGDNGDGEEEGEGDYMVDPDNQDGGEDNNNNDGEEGGTLDD